MSLVHRRAVVGDTLEGEVATERASYRDPAGFVYRRKGVLLRQVNAGYRDHYDALIGSGLYNDLTSGRLLIEHEDASLANAASCDAYRVLRPEVVPFVSYPFEWSFAQLRDAALATLEIMRRALAHDMVLKDASAFNIQFVRGLPTLIDTLSFECYRDGSPWVAYRQFCQHFLAPLLLMAKVDVRLLSLTREYLDGIPLDLASGLLPRRSWFNFSVLLNIHLHARSITKHSETAPSAATGSRVMSRTALQGLVHSLDRGVRRLSWNGQRTEWQSYADAHGYSAPAYEAKRSAVAEFMRQIQPQVVWDLGANSGDFSRIARDAGASVVAFDSDPGAVQRAYFDSRASGGDILPLLLDLTNPTPDLGWDYGDTARLTSRGGLPDAVLCLALIHHLALSHNLPLERIVAFLASIAPNAIVEFVPKDDAQARRLLLAREDIFADYSMGAFEAACSKHYHLREVVDLPGMGRRIYWLQRATT